MRRDLARSNRAERMPVIRRPSLATPWFDDIFEPTRWMDNILRNELTELEEGRFLRPAIDVDETENEYIVEADLPGVKKEDISVECSGNQLTISAERKSEESEGKRRDRRERFYGSYLRSFTLPAGCDPDKVAASYDRGVLTVKVPKGEQAKAKRIQISEGKETENRNQAQQQSKH